MEQLRGIVGRVTAGVAGWSLMRGVRAEMRPLLGERTDAANGRIKVSAREIFEESRDQAPDRHAEWVIRLCSLILASYRELQAEGVPRHDAYEVVRRGTLSMMRGPTRSATSALILASPDPVRALSRGWYVRLMSAAFGRGFEFSERKAPGRIDVVVNRCAFNNFFVAHEEPLLTRMLCEWDRAWFDPINASRRPIRVERPVTISTGCDHCSFDHIHSEAGEGADPNDVVLERRPDVEAALR